MSSGILYIASGKKFIQAAIRSAKSVRRLSDIPIQLFANLDAFQFEPAEAKLFTSMENIPDPHIRSKVDYLGKSQFDRTLYLDTDTYVINGIDEIFAVLDRFDLGAVHAVERYRKNANQTWKINVPPSFPQYNSGVIVFNKNDNVLGFLDDWRKSFHEAPFPTMDQITFREELWHSNIQLATLPPEYNIRAYKYLFVWEKQEARPKILHFSAYHRLSILNRFRLLLLEKYVNRNFA